MTLYLITSVLAALIFIKFGRAWQGYKHACRMSSGEMEG